MTVGQIEAIAKADLTAAELAALGRPSNGTARSAIQTLTTKTCSSTQLLSSGSHFLISPFVARRCLDPGIPAGRPCVGRPGEVDEFNLMAPGAEKFGQKYIFYKISCRVNVRVPRTCRPLRTGSNPRSPACHDDAG